MVRPEELVDAGEAFLSRWMGDEIYRKWAQLSQDSPYASCSTDFISWLLDLGRTNLIQARSSDGDGENDDDFEIKEEVEFASPDTSGQKLGAPNNAMYDKNFKSNQAHFENIADTAAAGNLGNSGVSALPMSNADMNALPITDVDIDTNLPMTEVDMANVENTAQGSCQAMPYQYFCEVCKKAFESTIMLQNHKCHQHSHQRKYPCADCSNSFSTLKQLQLHRKTEHRPESKRAFMCTRPNCGLEFVERSQLNVHMKTHNDYLCTMCDYSTNAAPLLRRHLSAKHKQTRVNKCEECGYTTKSTYTLRQHIATHSPCRPHACTVCGYTCKHEKYLAKHMKTHSDEKPFACTRCDYRTRWKKDLKSHLMAKHDIVVASNTLTAETNDNAPPNETNDANSVKPEEVTIVNIQNNGLPICDF